MQALAYYPENNKFPSPINLRVVELYLTSIIMNIYNTSDINIIRNIYTIPVVFKDFESLLEISYTEEPYKQFNLKIGNERVETEPCLHLRIYYDNEIVGKLVFVRSKNVVCPIPEENAGTWLVEFTNALFCSLGIGTIYLEDDAVVQCNGNVDKLFFIRIFKGEQTSWYQKFGYELNLNTSRVQNKYPGYNKIQYENDIVQLRNYPFSMILDGVRNLETVYNRTPVPYNTTLLEDGIAAIHAINRHPSSEITLGNYMSELWKNNCHDYAIINKFLRNSSRPIIDPTGQYFIWAPLYHRIEFVSYDYSRTDKC